MQQLIMCLLLLLSGPAWAADEDAPKPPPLVTWHFAGTLADGGTIDGTFSYPEGGLAAQIPDGPFKARPHLQAFALTKIDVTARPNGYPPVRFQHENKEGIEGNGICMGPCFYRAAAAHPSQMLGFGNYNIEYKGQQYESESLMLVFMHPIRPVTGAPDQASHWGALDPIASELSKKTLTAYGFEPVYRIKVRSVTLTREVGLGKGER